jgi:CheY-like chemotaxis protein
VHYEPVSRYISKSTPRSSQRSTASWREKEQRRSSTDDNAENLYLIEALFRGHGHEVVSVRNGQEALDAARANRFDVIVSDLLMPRMDGFQLIRELREDPQLSDIPIVIYTATYTDAKDEALVYRLGADRFLIKPADSEDLLRVVEEAIRVRCLGCAPGRSLPARGQGERFGGTQRSANRELEENAGP